MHPHPVSDGPQLSHLALDESVGRFCHRHQAGPGPVTVWPMSALLPEAAAVNINRITKTPLKLAPERNLTWH
jgi:hypothetical protein